MKKIIVIKIGSSVLMTKRNKLDEFRIAHIAEQVLALQKQGLGIILIISGAVAYGSRFIKFQKGDLLKRQAAAGIGQIFLTSIFNSTFNKINLQLSQILLTKDFLKNNRKSEKLKNLLLFYSSNNYIPLINENDVLDLNNFGGNDLLAAEITKLIKAEKLIILSTMGGSVFGIGGGETKQEAKNVLAEKDIETFILNGKAKNILIQKTL